MLKQASLLLLFCSVLL